MPKGRKPDYDVAALNKDCDVKGNIGAAWKNQDGTISVVLNNFVTISQDGALLITLFPRDYKPKPKPVEQSHPDDDMPF